MALGGLVIGKRSNVPVIILGHEIIEAVGNVLQDIVVIGRSGHDIGFHGNVNDLLAGWKGISQSLCDINEKFLGLGALVLL